MPEYNISFTEDEIRVITSNLYGVKVTADHWSVSVRDPFDSAHSKFDMMVAFLNDKVAYADELEAVEVEV